MTHESERTYHERVVAHLREEYGEDNVETEKYLKETYRFADVWVETPLAPWAIEIENDFEAALKGIGQAALYSAHEVNAVPAVILPPDHVEEPEAAMLRARGLRIIELDV